MKSPPSKGDELVTSKMARGSAGNAKPKTMSIESPWFLLALCSGAFAAFNGVFAKLTTSSLTSQLIQTLSHLLALDSGPSSQTSFSHRLLELSIRGTFFALNLLSNGVMWALFTRALTAHHSATQVSVVNASANFLLTALLGAAVLAERLPPLWFAGAALMVAGTVVIGKGAPADDADLAGDQGAVRKGKEVVDRVSSAEPQRVLDGSERQSDAVPAQDHIDGHSTRRRRGKP